MEDQRKRIITRLWAIETPVEQHSPDDPQVGHAYTRRELLREGNIERRQ